MTIRRVPEMETHAYGLTCPPAEEVTRILQELGFGLTFWMKAMVSPPSSALPPLPAQYHYRDAHGTEVIYLAGRDVSLNGIRLPPHASRWWVFSGADWLAYEHVKHVLTRHWSVAWQPTETATVQAAPCAA